MATETETTYNSGGRRWVVCGHPAYAGDIECYACAPYRKATGPDPEKRWAVNYHGVPYPSR